MPKYIHLALWQIKSVNKVADRVGQVILQNNYILLVVLKLLMKNDSIG